MEKDKIKVHTAFMRSTFTPIIRKIFCYQVLLNIAKLKGTVKFPGYYEQKENAFFEFLQGDKAKNFILGNLNALSADKTDVLSRVLSEYSMDRGELVTYDHDVLTMIFDAEIKVVQEIVREGRYSIIYEWMTPQ